MISRRVSRPAALLVAVVLAIAAVGAIITAPREYPVTAFLLAPLAAAIIFGRRVTAILAVAATIAGAVLAIAGNHYEGAELWFRLLFLATASYGIVALAAAREQREATTANEQAMLRLRFEQRYRSLVEATSAIVWTVSADGRFLEPQHGWEAYTGQRWPAYRDHGWLRAVHPDDRERFVSEWLAALAEERVDATDCRLWHAASNEYRFVVARGVPIIEGDAVREWIGTVTDVHDRTKAVLSATADAQLRTAVLQSLHDGVFVTEADGTVMDVNDALPRMFGYDRREIVGSRPPYPWWPDPDQYPAEAAAVSAMSEIISSETDNAEYELSFRHKDGHAVPVIVSISVIRDARGGVAMLVGTVKDVTRHAAAEARLRVFARLTTSLASARDLAEVGAAALAELLPLLGGRHGRVFVVDPDADALRLVAEVGQFGQEGVWEHIPLDLAAPAVDAVHSGAILVIADHDEFVARYPGLADNVRRLGLHTMVLLPLITGDVVVGVVFLAFEHRRPLHPDEIELLRTAAPTLAQALDRAHLFEFQRSVASTLQRAMLTAHPMAPVDMAVAARYVPAVAELSVGGDWYDVVSLDARRVAIAVGDIVGRGINAAAVMGQLRSALSAVARTTASAVDAVASLDRFAHGIEGAKATTLLYGIVDADARTLRYTSAGHPPALVVDAHGNTRFLDGGRGWPLAVADPDRPRPEAVAELAAGTTIILYTDGLVERRNEPLEHGLQRLARAASTRAELPVERLCDELLDELVGDGHNDDVALVVLRMSQQSAPFFTCRVPAAAGELAHVRHEVRSWLESQALPEPVRDDMVLAVGEACSNAVEHAYASGDRDAVVIEGFRSHDELVFTVRDYGAWRPLIANPQRNRGLRLIAEVTDDVVVGRARDGGTRVEMRRAVLAPERLR
jgi:PAS domain S-box-containing protein